MYKARLALAVLALVVSASPALAQLVDGPSGATGGVFGGRRPTSPNRTSHSLEMSFDFSGGHDQDPNSRLTESDAPFAERGGTAAEALISSLYRAGHSRRTFDIRGRGNVNYLGTSHIPMKGGGVSVGSAWTLGRRNDRWLFGLDTAYQPGWVFGVVNPTLPVEGQSPRVEVAPQIGIIEQRWLTMSGSSTFQHNWSPRQQSSVQVGLGRVRPVGDAGLNSQWQNAMLTQSLAVRSGISFVGSYRFDRFDRSQQLDRVLPPDPLDAVARDSGVIRYQSGTMGMRVEHRLSSVRRVNVMFSGGATQLLPTAGSSRSNIGIQPTVALSVEYVPSQTWSVSVAANRQVAVLAGVTGTAMNNDTLTVNVNGTVARRLRLAMMGNYLKGATLLGSTGSTEGLGGSVSLRYGFGRWLGMFASYSYYHHEVEALVPIAAGIPPLYDRQSARVGFTMWLPLYGTF
jgi:hypothetical protein